MFSLHPNTLCVCLCDVLYYIYEDRQIAYTYFYEDILLLLTVKLYSL